LQHSCVLRHASLASCTIWLFKGYGCDSRQDQKRNISVRETREYYPKFNLFNYSTKIAGNPFSHSITCLDKMANHFQISVMTTHKMRTVINAYGAFNSSLLSLLDIIKSTTYFKSEYLILNIYCLGHRKVGWERGQNIPGMAGPMTS
jgi:hypothetical protein